MPSPLSNLLELACSSMWAMRPEALEAVFSILHREEVSAAAVAGAFHFDEKKQMEAARAYQTGIPMRAVGTRASTPVDGASGLYRRGSVAILPITGTITRYSNFMQAMSGGGAVVESLAKDFQTALDDPSFTAIMLSVDSPGGEANGIAEFADQIFQARDSKPVWAYVSDLGASAAYWIASAAERVIIAETGALGSIGCVAVFKNPAGDKNANLEFVSSKSPNKRPDLTTEKGRQTVQTLVDAYGDIFINAVARNRGTTAEDVVANFGGGGLKLGHSAIEAGMAEEVGSFESSLAALADYTRPVAPARPSRRAAKMSLADRLRALLDAPETEIEASATTEVPTVPTPNTVPVAAAAPPAQQDEVTRARAELAAANAENSRLRLHSWKVEGAAWFAQVVSEMRAFPAEEATLIAQYVQAAHDDATYGMGIEGTSRVAQLKQVMATRMSVKHLTAEALAPTTLAAIMTASKPAGDPNAPMTAERKTQLHQYSVIGQGVLANGKNGSAKN
jgi:ClpP class serine protease